MEIPKMLKIGTKIVLHYLNLFFLPSVSVNIQLGRQNKSGRSISQEKKNNGTKCYSGYKRISLI